ncbi:MAG: DUF3006 domain-containing protein [Ruminiclostridium sp.]|nr:DUF3006 domain-containing protein [Ruminiclostridium sp.]
MLIIDRFQGNFAVVEDSETDSVANIDKALIDEAAKEGDVLSFEDDAYIVDAEATERRRREILELMKKLDLS